MAKYEKMTNDELLRFASHEDASAMYELGLRYKKDNDLKSARKYFTLAAQLFNGKANLELADMFDEEGDEEMALEHYRSAYLCGIDSAIKGFSKYMFKLDVNVALEFLISSAVSGSQDSIEMLEKYYQEQGDKEEAKFWSSKKNAK